MARATAPQTAASGIRHGLPEGQKVHTVVDVGGQDTKVLALDEAGEIEDLGRRAFGVGPHGELHAATVASAR